MLQKLKLCISMFLSETDFSSCYCFFRLPVVCSRLKHSVFVSCLITFGNDTIFNFVVQ